MVFEEIFNYADKNSDGYLSIQEVVELASPDVNNDKVLSEAELSIGRKTARVWLAYMLHFDKNNDDKILSDNKISLVELKKCSGYTTPDLWVGEYVNGERALSTYGSELIQEVDQML